MLTKKDFKALREELDYCQNPLFFFDDDSDGLSSFLLFYRYKQAGHGIVVKLDPKIDESYLRKVEEYQPDKIFILDLVETTQEFIDQCKVPVVIVDHHGPIHIHGAKYFNPRLKGKKHIPTSNICYEAVQQDLWVAMCGIVGDWFLPVKLKKAFAKQYPDLLDVSLTKPDDALFDSNLSKLIRIMQFSLKGKTDKIRQNIKVWTRIKDPYEVLHQTTPQGRFLYKHYEIINSVYVNLLTEATQSVKDSFVVFTYPYTTLSLSGELSNELLHRFNNNIVVVGRVKEEDVVCSLRSPPTISIRKALEQALIGIQGRGGGHEQACGATIKKVDFDRFIEQLKEQVALQKQA